MKKIKQLSTRRHLPDVSVFSHNQIFKHSGIKLSGETTPVFYFETNINGDGCYNTETGEVVGRAYNEKGDLIAGYAWTLWHNLIPVPPSEVFSVWPEIAEIERRELKESLRADFAKNFPLHDYDKDISRR